MLCEHSLYIENMNMKTALEKIKSPYVIPWMFSVYYKTHISTSFQFCVLRLYDATTNNVFQCCKEPPVVELLIYKHFCTIQPYENIWWKLRYLGADGDQMILYPFPLSIRDWNHILIIQMIRICFWDCCCQTKCVAAMALASRRMQPYR